ncbi:hypothetical protein GKE82_22850 [Conexibacter sp. W3-3-2]|uniref:Uncharacterized protein n=1 Tax=Paraconexibacter algicola TaxID=2133960 RepID=A0A2T4UFV7_9ACTN|nr:MULTISPECIES: hypothetical protein [Solirubrobacterales]MTD47048.1 hypothetical protein [Conexibacter sp. W3-3-2]PTL56669.1 hypothetical protein C7Y72_15580 [Paraconexibacter algicola]
MYQFSRAIYRELAPLVHDHAGDARVAHASVLRSCESAMNRLATDRHYFARPARTLFNDIRIHFPMAAQARVWLVVQRYVACAEEFVARQPRHGVDANGDPLRCRATTRRGTACQREPLAHNGYCPSHQHLAETEEVEAAPLAA